MDLIVKGRHTDVHERFKKHATHKLAKVERLDHKVIRIDVEVSRERNPRQADRQERVELTCRSRGPTMRAEASAGDRYAALDMAVSRLEARLRKMRDRRKVHRGAHTPTSVAAATAPMASDNSTAKGSAGGAGEPDVVPETASDAELASASVTASREKPAEREELEEQPMVPIQTQGQAPLVVREKFHHSAPMTIEQALFEMELVGHDFYLFHDHDSGHPSVVYRRHGYDYGVIRLIDR